MGSITRLGGFRALKKTPEVPYTTKVNYREPTSRGTTPPCVASAALRQHGLLSRWQRAVSPPQPRQSRPERLASRTTWKKAHYTASRHPHFEAAPEGARRRTCKGEQQRFPREDCRLSAYQAAEAYRLTACSGRLWRSENALPVNPSLFILRRIGPCRCRSPRLWVQAFNQAFILTPPLFTSRGAAQRRRRFFFGLGDTLDTCVSPGGTPPRAPASDNTSVRVCVRPVLFRVLGT